MKTNIKLKLIFAGSIIAMLVVMPIELFHGVAWVAIHAYEVVEFALDEVIHHVFHTSLHTTQVIVFYLTSTLILLGAYGVWRWLLRTCRQAKQELSGQWPVCKQHAFCYWQDLPPEKKIKMVSVLTFGGAFMAFWALA